MDILTLLSIIWRRWFVVVPVLIVTLAAAVELASGAEVRYETYGSELLVAQSQTGPQESTGPALSPELATNVVANALRRPEFDDAVQATGAESDFDVEVDPGGSLMTLTVTGDDAEDVVATAAAVVDLAPGAVSAVVGEEVADRLQITSLTPVSAESITETDEGYSFTAAVTVFANSTTVNNPFPPSGATIRTLTELSFGQAVAEAVVAQVPEGSYSVTGDQRPTAPILEIRAGASEAADVGIVYEIVRDEIARQLETFQTAAGVEPSDQTVLFSLVAPSAVAQTSSSVVRPIAGIVLLGMAAACAAAIAADLLLQRRAARRGPQRSRARELVKKAS